LLKNKTNKEVLEILDYLAWCMRVNMFPGDFSEKFQKYAIEVFGWDKDFALIRANEAYKLAKEKGFIHTYQSNITDLEFCEIFAHTINIG
jgi:hypothetical protein